MTEKDLQEYLVELLDGRTFEEEGIMSNNKGIVLEADDGSEFQLTIVKSR